MNNDDINQPSQLARRLRGEPTLAAKTDLSQLSAIDWIYLLKHCPNNAELVSKCDKWPSFSPDNICDMLCEHPQLKDLCPDVVWSKFGLGHWARLISKGGHTFAEKMTSLGVTERISDWCCADHWAEEYATLFVKCAAATPHDEKVKRIAKSSAMNPNFGQVGSSRNVRYHDDTLKHIQWLASVAADFEKMAQNTDVSYAEQYALIAEAANYEIQVLQGKAGC